MKISIKTAQSLIYDLAQGHYSSFFTVTFITKDNRERKMNCRLLVKKYLKGGSPAYNAADYNLLHVCDIQIVNKNIRLHTNETPYRSINLSTVKSIALAHQYYEIAA